MTKTWCVGGRHHNELINQILYERVYLKSQKLVKVIEGSCCTCGRNKSHLFTKLMTRGEDFEKRGKCKIKHCSPMSNSAGYDLNSGGNIVKLHDKYPNVDCNCQRQIFFTPKQFNWKEPDLKTILKKKFKGTQTA